MTEKQNAVQQLLTFRVGGEVHALPLLGVREILPFSKTTPIPGAPPEIRGLTNLRGTAVPLIDLAIVFGKSATPTSKRACIIILDAEGETEQLGVVTDEVLVVIAIDAQAIDDSPAFANATEARLIEKLACVDGEFLPILDVERIFSLQHRDAGTPDPDESGGDSPSQLA